MLCNVVSWTIFIISISPSQVVLPAKAGLVQAPGGRPEVVDLMFNGTPMREKKTKLINGITPEFTITYVGPYAECRGVPMGGLTKQMWSDNLDHTISSFPDYTINSAMVKTTPQLLESKADIG